MPTSSSSERLDSTVSKELMRRLPLFADLTEEDLDRLYEMARSLHLPAGEQLIEEGSSGEAIYIIIDGELEVTKREGAQNMVLATRGAGEVIGEMSLVQQAPRSASVRALHDTHLLVISRTAFEALLSCSPTAPLTILRTITARLRSTESLLMQQEKMAALGTMAAGLAHELNNPAAAIRRSTAHLREALGNWEQGSVELSTLALAPEQRERLLALREEVRQRTTPPHLADPLARSDQEEEVQEWLENRGVEQPWEAAPVLVSAGWERTTLEQLSDLFSAEQIPPVVRWLAAGAEVDALLEETGRSARAISEIVSAVKTYSHLDRAPIQDVDVHESLENTLVILRHKTKQGTTIQRDYASDLPRIEAYASELNQVWTNLLDNAIDAMRGEGQITLRTRARGEEVVVEIKDSGPGIPAEVQPHIFEPFFTTKAPGLGTGLGLHITYNTVVHRHHGQLRVSSRPGETCFQVRLPVRLPRE